MSSGLAKLPIAHVYLNGNKTNQTTDPYLPDGTPLNGSKAYEHMLSYFTTTNITPDEVHALGYEMIDKLYSQVKIKYVLPMSPSQQFRPAQADQLRYFLV